MQESSEHGLPSLQLSAGPPTQAPPLHASGVVHAFPSLHGAVLFVLTQPVDVLHESFVQTLPSLQLGAGPPTHVPPLHVSAVVHAFPSLQDTVLFALTHPVDVLHESFVQTLLSLQLSAGPPTQVPSLHASGVVQAFPSLQEAVLFALTQPVDVLHESFVQTLPSLQLGAGPGTHRPPLHASGVVHAFPSLHGAVLFVLTQPVDVLQESFVHTLPSLQSSAGPATQIPALHVSVVVHAFPSLQGAVLFTWTQPLVGLQVSSVQALPSSHADRTRRAGSSRRRPVTRTLSIHWPLGAGAASLLSEATRHLRTTV